MATQLAAVEPTRPDPLRQAIERMAPEFKMALPSHVTPDKFIRVAMTAINGNPELRDADRKSLYGAVTKLAQDGLLPDGREAALVIFNTKNRQTNQWEKRVQAMPMIAGLLKLMRQSGEVAWVDAHIVCQNDRFVYRPGLDDVPVFEPDWFGDRGAPIGAYAIAKLKTGEIVPPEIMSVAAIEKVRSVSRSKDKGPWVDWWEQQALKTVLRRFLKRLPTSADVERAFDRDETMQAQFDGEPATAVEHQPMARLSRLDAIEHQIEERPAEPPEIAEQAELLEAGITDPDDRRPDDAPDPQTNDVDAFGLEPVDEHPGKAKADALVAEIEEAMAILDIDDILGRCADDIAAMEDADAIRVEVAASQRKRAIEAARKGAKVEAE